MKQKDSWFLKIWDDKDPEVFGIGEASPMPGLSMEKPADIENQLDQVAGHLADMSGLNDVKDLDQIDAYFKKDKLSSSVTFGLESALLDLANGGKRVLYDNDFSKGKSIPINGLVWMGGLDYMLQQVSIKIDEGFTCVKLKIGGINFEKELDILQFIRRKYFRDEIAIRLDANGAFRPDQALYKLMDCSRYDVHSMEQPLKPGSPTLPELCRQSPVPIALDEELIGVSGLQQKTELLERIKPAFLVLKPSLHGGLHGCKEWISLAESHQVGWWLTSALESNVGLNAIAQFTSGYPITTPQGLGTGSIYNNNIPSPLEVKRGTLWYNSQENWDFSEFN